MVFTQSLYAQIQPPSINGSQKDTIQFKKSNTADWKDESYRLFYKRIHSNKVYLPDTGIHSFHRRFINQPLRDLGNNGSAVRNLQFTPENRLGPTLGYHIYDAYRHDIDSINYYNSNRPYSSFLYQLGGKQEQMAAISHTQNIKPNWNVAVSYRKLFSPGYYDIQRSNNDNAFLSTYYQSKKLNYELYGGIVYNKHQQDENGGIVNDTFLTNKSYNDRRTVPVAFKSQGLVSGTLKRSSVSNVLRDYSIMIQHGYTWGKRIKVYNSDSSKYSYQLTPRFGVTHRLEISGTKHLYQDLKPDSTYYSKFFQYSFGAKDSVYSRQEWTFIDNRLLLNGFIGKRENQLRFSAGLGNRSDVFTSFNMWGFPRYRTNNSYVAAILQKEALLSGKWFYQADVLSYFTGDYAGNTMVGLSAGKELGKDWGRITAGAKQHINSAPYNYTNYYNQYDTMLTPLNKESVTQIYVAAQSDRFKINAGYKNFIINNYIYLDSNQLSAQYTATFTVSQAWFQKAFKWKSIVLDNEILYQITSSGAPVNLPQFTGRHQLSIERDMFNKALSIAAGIELRYHTSYTPAGYSPMFNRYYYQNSYFVINQPEESIFFNFRVKRFRCYLMLDQVQQLFTRNSIIARGYAAQNFMFRFGFNWVMIN